MKRCPLCRRTYTDEALKFCRDDGTLLQQNSSGPAEASATLILPDAPAVDGLQTRILQGEAARLKESAQPTDEVGDRQTGKLKEAGDVPARSTGRIRRGRRGAAAVAAGLLVLVAAGAGAWLYKSSGGEQKKPVVIAIISAEGGRPLKTFPLPREGEAFANVLRWTPDGSAVVYARVSEGVSNLWAQPLDGKPARQITDFTSERIFWFDFSHDGKQLALTRGTQAGDVVLIKDFR